MLGMLQPGSQICFSIILKKTKRAKQDSQHQLRFSMSETGKP